MEIIRCGSRASTVPSPAYFTGAVRQDPIIDAPEPARLRALHVTFEPSARTAWHTHPLGQTLIITAGRGWVADWGKPRREVQAGDVIWFAPGEKHWHGATSTTAVSHIAIQEALNGVAVEWLEQVNDADYEG